MVSSYATMWMLVCILALALWSCNAMHADKSILNIPLKVSVFLAGEIDESGIEKRLKEALPRILPFYSPPFGNTTLTDALFEINYRVAPAHTDEFAHHYKTFVESHKNEDDEGTKLIRVEEILTFIENNKGMNENAFLTVDLSDALFDIPIVIYYSPLVKHTIHSGDPKACTQSVFGNIAFYDLSATPCDLRASLLYENLAQIHWRSPNVDHPSPLRFADETNFHKPKFSRSESKQFREHHVVQGIIGLITSAVQGFSAGDLQFKESYTAGRIICPIVIVRNGGIHYRPKKGAAEVLDADLAETSHGEALGAMPLHVLKPDIERIRLWLQSLLLPKQELVLLTTTLFVDDHPHLAVAVSAAMNTFSTSIDEDEKIGKGIRTRQTVPYIDSGILRKELLSLGGKLFSHLLNAAGYGEDLNAALQVDAAEATDMRQSRESILHWTDSHEERVKAFGRRKKTKRPHGETEDDDISNVATVVPIVVLSDMHLHLERSNNAQASGSFRDRAFIHKDGEDATGKETEDKLPIQPLLDAYTSVKMVGGSAVALHASEELMNVFNPHAYSDAATGGSFRSSRSVLGRKSVIAGEDVGRWMTSDMTDIHRSIAEGLTLALTGMNSPMKQLLQAHHTVDLTWTHGSHPFAPFGTFNQSAFDSLVRKETIVIEKEDDEHQKRYIREEVSTLDSLFSWASKRTALMSRAQAVCSRAQELHTRASLLMAQVADALVLLNGVMTNPGKSGKGKATDKLRKTEDEEKKEDESETDIESPTGMLSAVMENMRNKDVLSMRAMPQELMEVLIQLENSVGQMTHYFTELQDTFSNPRKHNADVVMAAIEDLELELDTAELRALAAEFGLTRTLSRCRIDFEDDLSTTQQIAQDSVGKQYMLYRTLNFVGESLSLHSVWKLVRGSWMIYPVVPTLLLVLVALLFGLKRWQEKVEMRLKKNM